MEEGEKKGSLRAPDRAQEEETEVGEGEGGAAPITLLGARSEV